MGHHDADRFEGRSGFGVRRPLRFLRHKLDLDEKQITELVRILDELKTERAQAEVDDRRALAEFAMPWPARCSIPPRHSPVSARAKHGESARHTHPLAAADSRPADRRTTAAARVHDPQRHSHRVREPHAVHRAREP